jgi:hypothetical protein
MGGVRITQWKTRGIALVGEISKKEKSSDTGRFRRQMNTKLIQKSEFWCELVSIDRGLIKWSIFVITVMDIEVLKEHFWSDYGLQTAQGMSASIAPTSHCYIITTAVTVLLPVIEPGVASTIAHITHRPVTNFRDEISKRPDRWTGRRTWLFQYVFFTCMLCKQYIK